MWFKQIQLFPITASLAHQSQDNVLSYLEKFLFTPCLPSMPSSHGWTTLWDEPDAPLLRRINHCTMLCLHIEEKILPSPVIRKALTEKMKQIEALENRSIYQKEKLSLKDEITMTLLPRAFTKLIRVYAYLDSKHRWLVLGTHHAKQTERLLSTFKKSFAEELQSFDLKKLSPILTQWLKGKSCPSSFSIEKNCVLQDPNQTNRVIRCQQQDLFSSNIQGLIKEGCEVKQLGLSWKDQVNFVLSDDFSLRSICFRDDIRAQVKEMEPETEAQRLDADFMIMTATFSDLLADLLELFVNSHLTASHDNKTLATI